MKQELTEQERTTKENSMSEDICTVVVGRAVSFKQLFEETGIDDSYISSDFIEEEENFLLGKGGEQRVEMKLVDSLGEEEAAVQQGWERAKAEHLMAYAASAWDGKTWVVARGSSWRDYDGCLVVPTLRGLSSRRYLFLILSGCRGRSGWFLVARKCA